MMINKIKNKKSTKKIVVSKWIVIDGFNRVDFRHRPDYNLSSQEIRLAENLFLGLRLVRRYVNHTRSDARSLFEINPFNFVAFLLELKPKLSVKVWQNYQRFAKSVLLTIPDSDWKEAIKYLKTGELPATNISNNTETNSGTN